MDTDPTMTEETPSAQFSLWETKPRFAPSEPGAAAADSSFVKHSAKLEGAEVPLVDLKTPDLKAPDLKEPSSALAPVEPELEQTALVAVEPSESKLKILPHIEIDYSNYSKVNYPHVGPNINLRSVQTEAIDTYFSETEKRKVIISLPTGCGKTVAGLSIAGKIDGRVLWIAHRDELIEQPAKEIENHFPALEFGIEKAGQRNGLGKRVVISSIQTLSRKKRLEGIMRGAPFSVVIYDECHHATAAQAMRVLSWLGCFRKDGKGPRLLGLTATINRSDKISLGHVFDDVIYSLPIQEAIKLGFLVPPKSIKVYLPMRGLKKGTDGDISISDADREARRLNVAHANASSVKVHCGKRKTIVFTTSVDQAQRTAKECQNLGIKAEWVSGAPHMKRGDRKDAIKRFGSGEIQVLCCADLLTEGFDDKSIEAVVIARPTLSESRYIQMCGRGLRTCEHKTDCLLIDITTNDHNVLLMTADILLKPPEKKIQRKPRRKIDVPVDSNTEWQRLQSYLRSARIDTIEHGEITFARASDDLILTVAKDSHLVILRRTGKDGADLWVIEHEGIVYTLEPLTLQECMSVCDTLLPAFGGSAKPESPEWVAATERPTPPPGIMPEGGPGTSTGSREATQIVDPHAQLPLAMKFATGSDPTDLAEQVSRDIMNANAALFARGLRLAFDAKKCHLLGYDKNPPANREQWGWNVPKTKVNMPPSLKDAGGSMIGWIYGDVVCVDPGLAVKLAEDALKAAGEEADIKTSYLRTHLGVVSRTFKDMRRDWIKVKTSDVAPPEVKDQ